MYILFVLCWLFFVVKAEHGSQTLFFPSFFNDGLFTLSVTYKFMIELVFNTEQIYNAEQIYSLNNLALDG